MNSDGSIFFTGITGALGSWLAKTALSSGARVCALARGNAAASAHQRVKQSLAVAGAASLEGLSVVEGDILEENLAAAANAIPDDIGLVIHCAACTEFRDDPARMTHRTNVEGVRNVLEFARQRRVPVVHVSTAYVAGKQSGTVLEAELDAGQLFNNDYEVTKFEGELMARRWADDTGLPATILRPGIVAGDWHQGRALRFNTFYDMMHAMDVIGPAARGERLRVQASPEVTKNIIQVDYFSEASWRIIRRGVPGTYHLTHPEPITFGDLRNIFAELFDLRGIELVSEADFKRARPTHAERICHRVMTPYRPYMTEPEPVFDRRSTDAALADSGVTMPKLNIDWFRRLLNYARMVNWGRTQTPESVPAARANPVSSYFNHFLPGKVGRALLPDLRRLTARFGVVLREDSGIHWSLDVQNGILRTISTNGMTTECRFTVDAPTLLEIISARLTPQNAFFQRRVEITGDVAVGLKTAAVMAQFFRKFPFEGPQQ